MPAEPAQPAESEPADTGAAEPAPPPAEEPPPREAPETLVVALNLPSPGFQVGAVDGEDVVFAKGFEVDLVRALAKKLGTQARFVQVEPFGDLLEAGRKPWDLAVAEVTITDKRDRRVDFSDPYLLADQGVLLRKGLEQVPTSIAGPPGAASLHPGWDDRVVGDPKPHRAGRAGTAVLPPGGAVPASCRPGRVTPPFSTRRSWAPSGRSCRSATAPWPG